MARLVDSDMAWRKKAWDDGQALRSQAVGTKQRAMKEVVRSAAYYQVFSHRGWETNTGLWKHGKMSKVRYIPHQLHLANDQGRPQKM